LRADASAATATNVRGNRRLIAAPQHITAADAKHFDRMPGLIE
jgi:hypothetical protein